MIRSGFEFGLGVVILLVVISALVSFAAWLLPPLIHFGKKGWCFMFEHDFPTWQPHDWDLCLRCEKRKRDTKMFQKTKEDSNDN